MPDPLRFGLFMAPFHRPGENPTLALERDLDLIVLLDRLGFDEAWVGEHHTTGWETIAAPELFLAFAAERTRHIRLGTGAISLPYHHPLMVADRIVLLDHLTRGRVMFGVGPGGHLSDAAMLGLDPQDLRPRMVESLDVILRLFQETTPISVDSEWFTLRDAVLQLRPFQRPYPPIAVTSMESPAGMQLAGRTGAGVLSVSASRGPKGPIDLAGHWAIAEESAAQHGQVVSRRDWRLVLPMHIAETRKQAIEDARLGAGRYLLEYVEQVTGRPSPVAGPLEKVIDQMTELGAWVVGTPDDAIAAIHRLLEQSKGFGCLLAWGHEWASQEKIHRSYELLAREVFPHFQGSLDGINASNAVAKAMSATLHRQRVASVDRARAQYEADR